VLVTDEQGIWRLHEFDGDSIAPDLARQERALPVGSDERFRISEQIGMRAEEHLVGRLDELIPILIVATGPGSGWSEGSTRSIAVLWYERTPELLAALPKRLERDSVLGSAGEIGVTGRRNVASVRPSPDGSERAAFADAGISPNPVGELAHLSFTIGAPSDVTLQVHDLRGEVVLGIPPVSCTTAGRWQIAFDTANLPPGMYIARLQNGQGASATTRFVVPSRRGKE
jgi:hypothetical protein